MTASAIIVEQLGKEYQIGLKERRHTTFREALIGVAKSPLRRYQRLSGRTSDDRFWALRDITFEVPQGEVLGIIGRNGAGKSTLLKILSRITEPTEGRAIINGRIASLLEVGTGFHTELTGRENVYLNGAILGMSRAEINRKFDEIVDFAGVDRFLDTPIKRYSSGMKVRLAFAVAAHLEPEILIIDEVLAVGDQEFQAKCLGKMNDVATSGRTVLFVSHNMAAVESLCSRVAWLDGGKLVEVGQVEPVITSYLSLSTSASYEFDLESHQARNRGCTPILQQLRLTDDSDRLLSSVVLGEPFSFHLTLRSANILRGIGIGIHIYSSLGQRVLTLHTAHQVRESITLSRAMTIRCRVPRCHLMPGRYSIVVGLSARKQVIDRIDPVGQFDITAADFFGTGSLPSAGDGVFVSEAEWAVDDVTECVT